MRTNSPLVPDLYNGTLVAMPAHEFNAMSCRPVVARRPGADSDAALKMQAQVNQLWDRLPESERIAFHEFCCLNMRGPAQMRAVHKFIGILSAISDRRLNWYN